VATEANRRTRTAGRRTVHAWLPHESHGGDPLERRRSETLELDGDEPCHRAARAGVRRVHHPRSGRVRVPRQFIDGGTELRRTGMRCEGGPGVRDFTGTAEGLAALGFRDGGTTVCAALLQDLNSQGLLDLRLVVTDCAPILFQAVGARLGDPRMRNLPEQGPPRELSDDLRPNHKEGSRTVTYGPRAGDASAVPSETGQAEPAIRGKPGTAKGMRSVSVWKLGGHAATMPGASSAFSVRAYRNEAVERGLVLAPALRPGSG